MRVHVTLKVMDEQGNEKILADGPAVYRENVLTYLEKDTGIRHRITFGDSLVIERSGETRTTLRLHPLHSEGSAVNEYGEMKIDVKCHELIRENDVWKAEYSILSGDEQVLRQRLEWTIRQFS